MIDIHRKMQFQEFKRECNRLVSRLLRKAIRLPESSETEELQTASMAFLVFFFAARFISCHPAWKFFFNHFPVTFLEFPNRATNVNNTMSPRLRQRLHALYQIAFAPAGKLYRIGLLFTDKNAIRREKRR